MSTFLLSSSSAIHTEQMGTSLGQRVALRPEWGKIVFLNGPLGSGKTTFARGFFHALGCTKTAQSPTFSFFREYSFGEKKAVHADLYRFQEGNSAQPLEFVSAALQEFAERGDVLLIEWANVPGMNLLEFFGENSIALEFQDQEQSALTERHIAVTFQNKNSISKAQTMVLMDEFMTPVHVRRHIFAVTKVAVQIATALLQTGVFVDPDLVENGALCHDLMRYVDFKDFDDPSRYDEPVTPEKLQFWQSMKEKYGALRHPGAISAILRERGFSATAKLTEAHYTAQIFRPEPFSWEEKIVYYADKRVLHDRIVTLSERFADGRKRYAHEANPELEAKVFALEQELFAPLEIGPEDIF